MTLEWILVGGVLLTTAFASALRLGVRGGWISLGLGASATLGGIGWWQLQLEHKLNSRAMLAEKTPGIGRSGGYVGSDQCRACHPGPYQSWHQSFHRTMTQLPSKETVRGEFENVTLTLQGQEYHLQRRGDEFFVEMVDPDWNYAQTLRRVAYQKGRSRTKPEAVANPPRSLKRITMTTGSHHMQAYWTASDQGNMQFSLPFTYVFEDRRWVPRNDVFLIDPGIEFHPQVWNVNCITCHATGGQPRQNPKTKVISSRVAELGIACESCHGPGEDHVRLNTNPVRRYAQHRRGQPDPSLFNPARVDHVSSSEACGQCHAIRRASSPERWNEDLYGFRPGGNLESNAPVVRYDGANLHEPGQEDKRAVMEGSFWSDGQVRVSGREFLGLTGSSCYQRGTLSCLSCHSMHQYQDRSGQLGAGREGNAACVQCHAAIGAGLEQHTHHRPESTGSLCYNCHMPHTTYGLVKAIRSHTIQSPAVRSSLDTGRPNACNLCHLDRSLGWTARQLADWFKQPVPALSPDQQSTSAALLWLLTGDAGQRAIVAWHFGWEPARLASGDTWMAPFLSEILTDPYSTVRKIAGRSLHRLPGYQAFSCDYIAPAPEREQARQRALGIWRGRPPATRPDSRVLLRPDGSRDEEKVAMLLKQRNDIPMELLE